MNDKINPALFTPIERTKGYVWDAKNNRFLAYLLKKEYEAKGMWTDVVDISDSIANEYMGQPPEGKMRVSGSDGMPAWEDIPLPPNSELLTIELTSIADAYKNDIYDLNSAYLSAIVSDGPSEITKQQIVREQITQRKLQYAADISKAKEKYPV